jgi:signal transduction histidine kinase
METFRSETLKYCIGFTVLVGLTILYAGIWSLDTGFQVGDLLISKMSPFLWAACGLFFAGATLSSYLILHSTKLASWILCIFVSAGIFIFLLHFSDPYGIIAFLLPILFSAFLFDIKNTSIFIALVMGISTFLNINNFQGKSFQNNVLVPAIIVLFISVFILVTTYSLFWILEWYEKRYVLAYKNEQIIRDNEIELQRLVGDLKIYQEYLKTNNALLVAARNEADEAKKVKQVFVQNVSHELRTPLNLIIGFAETMHNTPYIYSEVNWIPELKEDVDCIYQNSQHLKSLIDDVLDLAALDSNSFAIHPEDIDIHFLIRSAVQISRDSYNTKGLFIKINLESEILMVHVDTVRIKQVILNLLSNGLKYTSKGGVTISTYHREGMAYVNIEDTGKGISESELEKVFEAFYQVDKSSNPEGSGTGLGLSISKQLVELHGGEIKISSKVGKGTIVNFSLPMAK